MLKFVPGHFKTKRRVSMQLKNFETQDVGDKLF